MKILHASQSVLVKKLAYFQGVLVGNLENFVQSLKEDPTYMNIYNQ